MQNFNNTLNYYTIMNFIAAIASIPADNWQTDEESNRINLKIKTTCKKLTPRYSLLSSEPFRGVIYIVKVSYMAKK
jgi:hypothetical protein